MTLPNKKILISDGENIIEIQRPLIFIYMRSIISFLFCVFPLFGFSQNDSEIKGLGQFKLLSTTTGFIDTLLKQGKTFIKIDNEEDAYEKAKAFDVAEYVPNKNPERSPFPVSHIPEAKVYRLNNYRILDRYSSKEILLIFYNGLLVSIDITDPEEQLKKDIESKFGAPTIEVKEKQTNCSNTMESITYSMWGNVSSNVINSRYGLMYTSNCETFVLNILHAYNHQFYRKYLRAQRIAEESKKKEYKTKILSDL